MCAGARSGPPCVQSPPRAHLEPGRREAQAGHHVEDLVVGGAVQGDARHARGALRGPRLLIDRAEGRHQVRLGGLALPEAGRGRFGEVGARGRWAVCGSGGTPTRRRARGGASTAGRAERSGSPASGCALLRSFALQPLHSPSPPGPIALRPRGSGSHTHLSRASLAWRLLPVLGNPAVQERGRAGDGQGRQVPAAGWGGLWSGLWGFQARFQAAKSRFSVRRRPQRAPIVIERAMVSRGGAVRGWGGDRWGLYVGRMDKTGFAAGFMCPGRACAWCGASPVTLASRCSAQGRGFGPQRR